MSFAKNILEKYGWKDGEGLGKNSDGIVNPIKASLKFNQAGLGVDQAKDLTNNWWERVFDEAANNLEVNKTEGQVSVRQKEKDGVEISNKSYSMKKLREKSGGNMTYGSFLKSSTLLANVGREEDITDHVKTEDIEFDKTRVLTDDELFAACEGRTAHKGARHGLKLSGKLLRIEEQNNALIERLKQDSFENVIKSNDWQKVKSKKSKKKKKHTFDDEPHPEDVEDDLKDMLNNVSYVLKNSTKRKASESKVEDNLAVNITTTLSFYDTLQDESLLGDEEEWEDAKMNNLNTQSIAIKKKNKKKKKNRKFKDLDDLTFNDVVDVTQTYKKNKVPAILDEEPIKKSKKKLPALTTNSEVSSEEDIVEKINEEQRQIRSKIRASNPKINIISVTDEDKMFAADKFKKSHKKSAKRVGKSKKRKRKDRAVIELATKLNDTVAL